MTMNMDPQKMQQVKQVSGNVRAEMRIYHQNPAIHLDFSASTPEAKAFLKNFVPQFGETMATMLTQFFGITGTIINIEKEAKKDAKVKEEKRTDFNKLRGELRMEG